jgi:hypothetical protein
MDTDEDGDDKESSAILRLYALESSLDTLDRRDRSAK